MPKFIIILYVIFILSNCSEKVLYSGKLIDQSIDYNNFLKKSQLIDEIGRPDYIDIIDNKFFYYSEKKIIKNFYKQKLENRTVIVFRFDQNDNILNVNKYDLNNQNVINFNQESTPSNLVERGLIEKIFGGIGKQNLSNTSQ